MSIAHPVSQDKQLAYANAWGTQAKSYSEVHALLHASSGGGGMTRPGPSRPYEQVVAIHRCINFIGDALSMMPFIQATDDDRILESGPLVDLADAPNPEMGSDDFWRESAGWLFLSRRLHWIALDMAGDKPLNLKPVPGELMKPLYAGGFAGAGGEILGWRYRPFGARWDQAITLEPQQVYTIKVPKFDVGNNVDGASTLDVIRSASAQVFKADQANERSLDHDVQPGGAFVAPPGVVMTDEQRKQFKSEVSDKNQGYQNRNRFILLEGGLDFKKYSATFSEMEFIAMQKLKFGDIAIAFGFDPAAIGMVEGGRYEFVKQAKASAWIDRLLPIADWLAGHWMRAVQRPYANDRSLRTRDAMQSARPIRSLATRSCHGCRRAQTKIRVAPGATGMIAFFDSSAIPAVRDAKISLAKEGAIFIETYKATPQQVIDMFDLGLPINEWQKVGWQNTSQMPIDMLAPGEEDPAGTAQEIDDAAKSTVDDEPTEGRAALQTRELMESQLAAIWTRWRSSWRAIEKTMTSRTRRHFADLRKATLARAEKLADQLAPRDDAKTRCLITWTQWDEHDAPQRVHRYVDLSVQQRDVIGQVLFDLVSANGKLLGLVRPILRSSVVLGGDQSHREHADQTNQDQPQTFNVQSPEAAAAMRKSELKITDANKTLRRRLNRQLAEAMENNEPINKIMDRIRREFNFANQRATTIARTEIGRAVEAGRSVGRQQAGTPLKSWLWSRKETGRPWHQQTEQNTLAAPVPNDQKFVLAQTGSTCDHPRATNVAKDDINCGCTTIARFHGDTIKSAIAYYAAKGFMAPDQMAALRGPSQEQTHDPA